MRFSIAPSPSTNAPAIRTLERPSANNDSTSDSRGVSQSSWFRRARAKSCAATSGSSAVPPSATRCTASTKVRTSATHSFNRYPKPRASLRDWDGQVRRHDLAELFKYILAEDIVASARNRRVETSGQLSKSDGDKMDQAWANLSATWASELEGTEKTSPQTQTKNPRTPEGVEGSVSNRVVGVEGLEPPTSAL